LPSLLARFAEHAFWMARYMERAENLARILDVNETFAQQSRGVKDWLPIVQLFSDAERFFEVHWEASADTVVHFYVLDRVNPSSIISAVRNARENARALRHLISTEMWSHLNVFYNRLLELRPSDLELARLSELCRGIKEDCQLHTGIVEGTFYRDQAWHFYQLGKLIERADQTTRLLDINHHRLAPLADDVTPQVDAGHWNAVLRSAAGYHAFRRVHPRGMQPARVAGFLLFDPGFPRSVVVCVREAALLFRELAGRPELRHVGVASEPLDTLERLCAQAGIDDVLGAGLHEFLDRLQQHLIALTDELGSVFFGHRHEHVSASQNQS
jgi:uncharacterized alpha-E superfamily protein